MQSGIGQQSNGYAGYIFRAGEWNHGRIIASRQEGSILLSDTPADKSPHGFVIRRRLDMNGIHRRPVEDAVGQPMLQIPEAGSMFEVAEGGVARDTLKLRIVHHEFESQRASGYRP